MLNMNGFTHYLKDNNMPKNTLTLNCAVIPKDTIELAPFDNNGNNDGIKLTVIESGIRSNIIVLSSESLQELMTWYKEAKLTHLLTGEYS